MVKADCVKFLDEVVQEAKGKSTACKLQSGICGRVVKCVLYTFPTGISEDMDGIDSIVDQEAWIARARNCYQQRYGFSILIMIILMIIGIIIRLLIDWWLFHRKRKEMLEAREFLNANVAEKTLWE